MKPPGFTAGVTTIFKREQQTCRGKGEKKKKKIYFIKSPDLQISVCVCLLPGVSPTPPCPPLTAPANDPLMTGWSLCETLLEYVSGPGEGLCGGGGTGDTQTRFVYPPVGMWIGDNQAGPGMWSRGCWSQEGKDGDGHPLPALTNARGPARPLHRL